MNSQSEVDAVEKVEPSSNMFDGMEELSRTLVHRDYILNYMVSNSAMGSDSQFEVFDSYLLSFNNLGDVCIEVFRDGVRYDFLRSSLSSLYPFVPDPEVFYSWSSEKKLKDLVIKVPWALRDSIKVAIPSLKSFYDEKAQERFPAEVLSSLDKLLGSGCSCLPLGTVKHLFFDDLPFLTKQSYWYTQHYRAWLRSLQNHVYQHSGFLIDCDGEELFLVGNKLSPSEVR